MGTPHKVLKNYWGYEAFRELQLDIIEAVLNKKDTLALLPTGGGKSICFQIPGLIINGLCIVISPLIALMKDQVEQLKRRGIKAAAIYSGLSQREIDLILDNSIYGETKFLYVSPERLKTEIFITRSKKMDIGLIAIDEAHCISQWGYDFRPSYLEIASFLEQVPKAAKIALTATATTEVEEDILQKLNFQDPVTFRKSFSRAHLSYSVFNLDSKAAKLKHILNNVPGSSVVYVRSRKRTQEIAYDLNTQGMKADFYHGGLDSRQRDQKQENWISNKTSIMVATNAFGMGIDKADVRTVIHLDLPPDLESYYQEAGRAGRDGKKAYAVVLYNEQDYTRLQENIRLANPELKFIAHVYQLIANYLKLATGSAELATFPFDLKKFIAVFKLDFRQTHFALKRLEDFGLIKLSDSFYEPSKLKINGSKEDIYRYEIEHKFYEHTLKALLRLYGGELFNQLISVDEEDIAKIARIDKNSVSHQLEKLDLEGLVTYVKKINEPQITFLTPRQDATKLPLKESELARKIELNKTKAAQMFTYLENDAVCRTIQLVSYFGENLERECGICDVCVARKRQEQYKEDELGDIILRTLEEEILSPEQLRLRLYRYSDESIANTMRIMLEKGQIEIAESNKILIKRSSGSG